MMATILNCRLVIALAAISLAIVLSSCSTTAQGRLLLKHNDRTVDEVVGLVIQTASTIGFIVEAISDKHGIFTLAHPKADARISGFARSNPAGGIEITLTSVAVGSTGANSTVGESLLAGMEGQVDANLTLKTLCVQLAAIFPEAEIYVNNEPFDPLTAFRPEQKDHQFRRRRPGK